MKDIIMDMNIDASFRAMLAGQSTQMSDAEKIIRLRSSVSGLLCLIRSFEDVTYSRDVPDEDSAALYESEIANAKAVLEKTK